MASSPILADGMVVVQVDHWSQSYLIALDPSTGANRWKVNREAAVNWSTPLPVKVKDVTQLVTFGTYKAVAYDSRNGAELWMVNGLHQQCIPSPVAEGNLVFAASGDGTLAIKLDGQTGDLTKSHIAWKETKRKPFVPSPLVYQGHYYVIDDKGIGICLEAATGKEMWKERLGGSFHAGVVAGDGKLYFATKEGRVRVVQAGPAYKVLADNDMGEQLIASPAVSNGQILLRGEKHLFCVGGK
jgi:hypothetical protein